MTPYPNGHDVAFPIWLRARLARTNEKVSLADLKEAYERETGQKRSRRTYERSLNIIGKGNVKRHEQLYWYPFEVKRHKGMVRGKPTQHNQSQATLHSSHNYRFSIRYSGNQPKDGKVRPWGRTRSQFQVEYDFGLNMRLQVFKNKIIVMLSNPKGITTQEQIVEARRGAYLTIVGFAKARNLELDGDLEKTIMSHHVLEPEAINKPIQAVLAPFAKEIAERTGSLVLGDGSHDGMEHTGKVKPDGAILRPEDASSNFEWMFWHFRREWSGTAGYMHEYNENLKLHLEVMREIRDWVREMRCKK